MKRVYSVLIVLALLVSMLPMTKIPVRAEGNPYPTSQEVEGVVTVPCTYYAWQQAYENVGIELPAWGDAINWYSAAESAGYSVGTEPQANSIAVWSIDSHSYGHVGFVTAVNGDTMTVNEGGRIDSTDNEGIVNGAVLPATVDSYYQGRTLKGFIYLKEALPDSNQNLAVYTAFLLDASGSMEGEPFEVQKESAIRFCTDLLESEVKNYISIIAINASSSVVTEFSDNIAVLTEAIQGLGIGNGTNIDNALSLAQAQFEHVSNCAAMNVILCTDGLPSRGGTSTTGPYDADDIIWSSVYANYVYNQAEMMMNSGINMYSLAFLHDLDDRELAFAQIFLHDVQNKGYYEINKPDDALFNRLVDDITKNIGNNEIVKHADYYKMPSSLIFDIKTYNAFSLSGNDGFAIRVGDKVFTTLSSGRAEVIVPDNYSGDIVISKEGYYTHRFPAKYARMFNVIYMHEAPSDKPVIENFLMKYSNRNAFSNIQYSEAEVAFRELSQETFDIYLSVNWCDKTGMCIYLQQGKTTLELQQGLNKKINLGNGFTAADGPIYLCLKTTEGITYKYKTKITPSPLKIDVEFDFGEDKSAVVDEEVQGLGGHTFELSYKVMDMIPVSYEIKPDGTVEGCIGLNQKEDFSATWYDEIREVVKKREKNDIISTIEKIKNSGGDVFKTSTKFGIEASVEILGYFKGYIVKESPNPEEVGKIKYNEFECVVSVGGAVSVSGQQMIYYVPVYWKVEVGLKIAFEFSAKENEKTGKMEVQLPEMTVTLQVKGDGCLGINKVIGAGVRLTGTVMITFRTPDLDFGTSLGELTVTVHGIAQLFCFEAKTGNKDPLFEEVLWGEKDEEEEKKEKSILQRVLSDTSQYTLSDFTITHSEVIVEDVGERSTSDAVHADKSVFADATYANSNFSIAETENGTSVAVWVGQDSSRSNANMPALYYALLLPGEENWTDPELVYQDGTADYYPVLKALDNKVYLIWMGVNQVVDDSIDLVTYSSLMDIYYSEFNMDTGSFAVPENLSSNDVISYLPEMDVYSGVPTVVWAEDENNNLIADSTQNKIVSASLVNGVWEKKEHLTGLSNLNSICVDAKETGNSIYYICDTDGNFVTTDDLEVFCCEYVGVTNRLTEDTLIDSTIQLFGNDVYWYSGSAVKSIHGELISINAPSDQYKLIQDQNGNQTLVYAVQSEDGISTDVYAVHFNENWGNPIKIITTENHVSAFYAQYDKTNRFCVYLNECIVENNLVKESGIFQYIVANEDTVHITDAKYSHYSVTESNMADVYVDIFNHSVASIKQLNIEVCDASKNVLLTQCKDVVIASGDSYTLRTNFPVTSSNYAFYVSVVPVFDDDSQGSKTEIQVEMKPYDISLERFAAQYDANTGKALVDVSVIDRGLLAANNLTLTIHKENADGEVVYSDTYTYPAVSESRHIGVELAGLSMNDVLYAEITTEEEENLYGNNSDYTVVTEYSQNQEMETVSEPEGDTLSVVEANDLGISLPHNNFTINKYHVTGVVTEIVSTVYGNMYIADEAGNTLYVYGSFDATGENWYDAMSNPPAVGDTVTVYGIIGQYNAVPEIKNAWIVEQEPQPTEPEPTEPETDTLSIVEAIALGSSMEHNTFTTNKYHVTGVVTEIVSAVYGNMYIADEAGNTLYVYGSFDATGENRYDAMSNPPAVGDTVTVYGIIGQYNGVPEIKNVWIVAHESGSEPETTEPETTEPETTEPAPTEPETDTLSIAEAIALGSAMEHNTFTTNKYHVTGVVTEIVSTVYGNMYIADETGNQLYIYTSFDATGENRYDAMSNPPAVGDTVTVYGIIGQYNGVPEIKNVWIVAHESGSEPETTEPETTVPPDAESDGLTYVIADGRVTITGYTGSAETLEIPETIQGYPVTVIGARAFYCCSTLQTVVMPTGVTTIEHNAFAWCANLKQVTIPDCVISIGRRAFYYCTELDDLVIPESVKTIEDSAFANCIGIEAVHYAGSQTQWKAITIGAGNEYLLNANISFGVPQFVEQWNVSLHDNLRITFHVRMAEMDALKIAMDGKETVLQANQLKQTDTGAYIASVELAAAQMTEPIKVSRISGTEETEERIYSVRQYCDIILNDASYGQYHALVKEMLNYGAMAQAYFSYDAEDPANEGITGTAAVVVPETAENPTVNDQINAVDFYGASLVYMDRITVRYYFTGDVSGLTFAANGNICTPVAKDGMNYVEVAEILPQNLNQQILLTVTDADGNTLEVSYGPMNYIVRMNQKGNDSLKALLKALYNYHLAAKAI